MSHTPKLVSITFTSDKRKNIMFRGYLGKELRWESGVPGKDILDHEKTIEELVDYFND